MATTKKRKPTIKKTKKKLTFLDRLPKNDIEHLERLIAHTEGCITGESQDLDTLWTQQAERLKKELKELKAKK